MENCGAALGFLCPEKRARPANERKAGDARNQWNLPSPDNISLPALPSAK